MMGLLRNLYYALPISLRYPARKLAGFFAWEKTAYFNGIPLPRKGDIFTGRGDFLKEGKEVIEFAKREKLISPQSNILDIGSGMGRAAYPLTQFLNSEGSYDGFDVVQKGVTFCTKHISSKFPNFNFKHVPLLNDLYTAKGDDAQEFQFPYPKDSFNLAIANSLFTHLQEKETTNYLKEVYRVLKPGGHLYATFFLLNAHRQEKNSAKAFFEFPHKRGNYALMSKRVKAANVAFNEGFIFNFSQEIGLEVKAVQQGRWDGYTVAENFQDLVILHKPS